MKKLLISSTLIIPLQIFTHKDFSNFALSSISTTSSLTTSTTNRLKHQKQQSYLQALATSTLIGSCAAIGCCCTEQLVPLWRPFNVIAARTGATLFLPSFVYAYLAFAEGSGITCHSNTMHTQAFIADWITYLIIKKVNY